MTSSSSTNASRTLSALGLVGGALHLLAPQLTVLPQDPTGVGLGPELSTPVLSAIGALAAVGSLILLRLRSRFLGALGAVMLSVGFILSAVIAEREFKLIVWVLPFLLLIALIGLWWTSSVVPGRRKSMALAAVAGTVIGVLISANLLGQLNDAYGPTHPESTVSLPDSTAEWLWLGAVDETSASVTAGGLEEGKYRMFFWSVGSDLGNDAAVVIVDASTNGDGIARFQMKELQPDTDYTYRVLPSSTTFDAANLDRIRQSSSEVDGTFRTFASGAQDLTIVVGSCARTGSNGAVYDAMLAEEPDLYLNLGDMHYGNLVSDDPADHLQVLGRSLSAPAQSALLRNVPTVWAWDDHDFGDNDTDSSSPSRRAVSTAYRSAVPHYDVSPDVDAQINQAFTVGRVRIIVTDSRSARTAETILGAEQEEWLIDEIITASKSHAVVIWANPTPWIGADAPGADQWPGYGDERGRIANAIAAADVENLVVVSGDSHLTALDDGTNTGYADDGSAGFPLMHAGPLDRPGRSSSVDYSHGSFSDAGQYGTVRIEDDGGQVVKVTLTANRWDDRNLADLQLEFVAP